MVRHYELIIYYCMGFKPRDAIDNLGVSKSSCYRAYANYRKGLLSLGFSKTQRASRTITKKMYRNLEKMLPETVFVPFLLPPTREKKVNSLDDLSDG